MLPNMYATSISHTENNPEKISFRQSNAALPRGFLSKFCFDLKMPKMVLKQGYPSTSNYHLPNQVPFYSSKCPFLLFWMLLYYPRLFPDTCETGCCSIKVNFMFCVVCFFFFFFSLYILIQAIISLLKLLHRLTDSKKSTKFHLCIKFHLGFAICICFN